MSSLEKKKEKYAKMSKKEKKNFLSMDMIERIIRVEQKVSSKFNKCVPYNETEYYKSLREEDKKSFDKYVSKNHRGKKILLFFAVLASLFLIFNLNFTGEAIKNVNSSDNTKIIGIVLIILIGTICFLYALSKRRRAERIDSHFMVIENLFSKKKFKKC
ncbi:hypothetical protein HYW76_01775 [Candidatus Pacearchaeota archaeon]|nr:hypothetical protein [Candidatus Pacearchaeota archaeon]